MRGGSVSSMLSLIYLDKVFVILRTVGYLEVLILGWSICRKDTLHRDRRQAVPLLHTLYTVSNDCFAKILVISLSVPQVDIFP